MISNNEIARKATENVNADEISNIAASVEEDEEEGSYIDTVTIWEIQLNAMDVISATADYYGITVDELHAALDALKAEKNIDC